jgi:photosystem II stability/assembly factor-like uncharacterized protein
MKKRSIVFTFLLCIPFFLFAQKKKRKNEKFETNQVEEKVHLDSLMHGMTWRNIGPFRGGRSTTVCGVIQDPFTFYFGSTGGGLWKTVDGGAVWKNISDGYLKTGSVGAVKVAPSDPNVIYVGMGEAPIRGVMTSHGDGVYKSTDAGETWRHIGLDKTRQISKIEVHPQNPDWVYVAAQGSPYMPTEERGVFLSKNGGQDWEKVLYVDSISGVCDLSLDVLNPRVIYAAFWDHQRLPWQMRSGGKGSSIWKSTDGGASWEKLSEGLPKSVMGKIGVAVSPAKSNRVYAIIESEEGGFYRSDNAGRTWQLINKDRILRARSWYYMHVIADPADPDKVVVLNAPFMQSLDGGKTFTQLSTPHGDNHALWIHPENPMIMINGNDGGGNVSYNGGRTWSTQTNQPTAQFYRVNADNQFPYYVYGGQQDNSSVAVPSAWTGPGIPYNTFYPVGGCESAFTAFDPDDPRLVYAGCYQGIISEYDTKLKVSKDIMAYPDLGLGQNPADMKYRFNWNAPILISQHQKQVMYHAGNKLLKSVDRGIHWEEISPDLTKNTAEKLVPGGGPITNEGAGGENYHTIMYVAESNHNAGEIWVGTDDGLVQRTGDGGKSWMNVTPPGLPEGMINCIELSHHRAGTAFIVFNRYKFNDFTPYVYITEDFGKTWHLRTQGIQEEAHVRVVRSDPDREGLLYAGTETGLYISFDHGYRWVPFQRNLPVVPITDLKVHHKDLIAATQGRAFWILDDLSPLHQWEASDTKGQINIFKPLLVYKWGGSRSEHFRNYGTNPDYGLVAYYNLPEFTDSIALSFEIFSGKNQKLKTYSSTSDKKDMKIKAKSGLNKLVWNLRPQNEDPIKGLMTLGGNDSPEVGAGKYTLKMVYGEDSLQTQFTIWEDPRLEIDPQDLEQKDKWLNALDDAAKELTETVKTMHFIKDQITSFLERNEFKSDTLLTQPGNQILEHIDSLQNVLVQVKQKTFQDVINFPNQLDAKIRHIQNSIDGSHPPVTQGQITRATDVLNEWKARQSEWKMLQAEEIAAYNELIKEAALPFISTQLPVKVIKP